MMQQGAAIIEVSVEEIVTKEHDQMVVMAIMEKPGMLPVAASLRTITAMLRKERELFMTGGDELCLTK